MHNVVVTGAAGIIGAVLTKNLSSCGYRVFAVVRPKSVHNSRIENLPNVQHVYCDLNNAMDLLDKINESCDALIHLAWSPARNDFKSQKASFDCALAVLEAASGLGCKRFIGIGSQAEYGPCNEIISECVAPNPVTFYGAFKASAALATKIIAQNLGMEWIWGRIFSVYGKYEPPTSLISYVIRSLRQSKSPELTSCEQYWDYLYDRDAANAIRAILEKGKCGEIYNIANGEQRRLMDYVEVIHKYLKPDIPIKYSNDIGVGILPDVRKIQSHTLWKAETNFKTGIMRLIDSL